MIRYFRTTLNCNSCQARGGLKTREMDELFLSAKESAFMEIIRQLVSVSHVLHVYLLAHSRVSTPANVHLVVDGDAKAAT